MVQCCLNGSRTVGVPLTATSLAESAAGAVAAGATDFHLHPKGPDGHDSLDPGVVGTTLTAMRTAVDVPVGITTGAWTEPDPAVRRALVSAWEVLPDHASVNWHERGAEELASTLIAHGIGVEAGLWTLEAARAFLAADAATGIGSKVLRVLIEVTDEESAHPVLDELDDWQGAPILLHGEEHNTWPVLRLAVRLGLATRIGLEDTLLLPDGTPATSNAELVAAALTQGAR